MSYPGNATLTREMQERIISTFKQTLSAAAAGNRQEATLGCDFILRLDSLFGPARELLERMETGEGPVATEDLAGAIGLVSDEAPAAPAAATPPPAADAAAPAAAAQLPDIDDLSDLDLEMGLSDPVPDAPEPSAEPAPVEPPAEPTLPPAASPPPAAPEAPATSPTAKPEPAAPEPLAVDELDDLDLGIGDGVDDGPATVEPPALEVPEPAAPAAAAAPAEPEPPSAPGLDELDDLDLSVGAEDGSAAAAGSVAEELAATEVSADEPTLEEAAADEPTIEEAAADEPTLEEAAADEPTIEEAAADEPTLEEAPADEPVPAETSPAEPEAATEDAAEDEAPAPAAPAPESVEIPLGSEPAAQLDSESQQRIEDLLTEGQEAFSGGEYQGAIDAWSRIFLIDIDHADANRRIEEARKLKAEADRKVEEKFHEGLAHLESGETDAAADSFRTVLEMQSSHLAARDYLEKLEAGEVPVPTELPKPADPEPPGGDLDGPGPDLADDLEEEPKAKPDRGTKPVGESMVSVKKSPLKSKAFLAVAAVGLIAVLGGAWYLFDNWSSLFPNSAQEEPAQTAADPLARAKGLHDAGKAPIAIAQLRRLPPDSPQYDEAQALIAQWELEQAPTDAGPEGPSPQELARREALVAEAGAAAERREFMRTSALLSEAAAVAPLKGPEVQLLARADEQLQELQNFITIFREGEWDLMLRDLWLLHESDPGNRDVTRLLVDSYYNLGLRALQRKDVKVAAEQFKEALVLDPDDPELLRLAHFAATYQTRATDLLYRIYVKYHPFR